MPAERLSMRKIKEVLRLSCGGKLSGRIVARSCDIGRTTVREYLYRAKAAGLSWPLPEWRHVHEELKRKGVTLFLLWEEYKERYPEGYEYSRFCDLYRD